MPVVDNEGRLFGLLNVVDAVALLVLLFVVSSVAVGVMVGFGSGDDGDILTQTVVIETKDVSNVSSVPLGLVDNESIVQVVGRSDSNTAGAVKIAVQLRVSTEDGVVQYRGKEVYIGQRLTLDLGTITVTGRVVDAENPQYLDRLPTPTPTPTPSPTAASPTDPEQSSLRLLTLTANVSAETAEAIDTGPTDTEDVVSVVEKSTNTTDDGTVLLRLVVRLRVVVEGDSVFFRGVEIKREQLLRLDIGGVVVDYTVVDVSVPS